MNDLTKFERLLKLLIALGGNYKMTISEIGERFQISNRSVMRDLATLRTVGFIIENRNGLYHIPKVEKPFKSLSDLLHFSEEEAQILHSAIQSIDDSNILKINLTNKLYALYNFDRVVDTVVNKANAHIVHQIVTAIKNKKQVLLRQYRSSHGSIVRDRLLEPFDFTSNYSYIWAYEPESRCSKLFKTARIGDVEILSKSFQFEHLHEKEPIDVFRISSKKKIKVSLKLSIRAYNLLIEEYPLSGNFLFALSDNCWHFETEVCGFEGVSRFILGLIEEVEIIEPESLKQHIKQRIKSIEQRI